MSRDQDSKRLTSCLHGMGTGGAIFKAQTGKFNKRLPTTPAAFRNALTYPRRNTTPSHSSMQPTKAPRPPPSRPSSRRPTPSFVKSYTLPDILAAPHRVLDTLSEAADRGEPYDALLCFSQEGLAVAGGTTDGAAGRGAQSRQPGGAAVAASGGVTKRRPMLRRAKSLWCDTSTLCHQDEVSTFPGRDLRALPPLDASDIYGMDLRDITLPRHLVLDLPTVQVYLRHHGSSVPGVRAAVFDTGGGHEIPRASRVSREIADAIAWLGLEIVAGNWKI
ncbi:hypothetical protein F4778DRAFT_783271 [Xylariomycetidae sp. FL2044]|nr:hypothetical protein F4778DRAFT_783271 [Xylariomycetidae sp. FL2044]